MNKVKNAVALMSFCVGTLYSSVLLAQSTEEVGSDLTRSDQGHYH